MSKKLDRYQILEEVGQGGFAIVYRAHDKELDRLVAVKELKQSLLQDTNWIKRFQREARAIARLDHPHIITVHDVIQDDDRFVIVMRLVDGPNLDSYITTRNPVPWQETLEILNAVAEGLDYAHSQNILHRDLKPANILIDPQRGPMLSDFGLAKLMGVDHSSVTVSGSVAGTPHYIAPEVWEEKPATPQTDIYALGCIVYEMVTGVKLFKGETPPAVMMAHFKPLELPSTWPQDVPPAIANVLYKALSAEPTDRYASAQELVDTLKNLSPDDPVEPHPTTTDATQDLSGATISDGDMRELVLQVTQQVVAESKRDQAAMWQHEAETALTEGHFDSAERAVRQWQNLNPDDPELKAFLERLAEKRAATKKSKKGPGMPFESIKEKKMPMKKGCIQKIIFIGVIILALIGAGTVCSQCNHIDSAMTNIQIGETETEEIFIPAPDAEGIPNLKINFDTGELIIAPGAKEGLVEGSAMYNAPTHKPKVTVKDNDVTLQNDVSTYDSFFASDKLENNWNLKLNEDTPLVLKLNIGTMEGDIELGGVPIVDLNVSQGTSRTNLSFSQPNPVEMDEFEFKAGASEVTVRGLGNANTKDFSFLGGAGDCTLDFGGQLQNDLEATVEFGLGLTTIIVPKNTPATVAFDTEVHGIVLSGNWEEVDGEYISGGEGPHINIIVSSLGPGELTLRN